MSAAPADTRAASPAELEIEEPSFFLLPILPTDPIPYLFDASGNPVDADGALIDADSPADAVPPVIRHLQEKHHPR